MRITIKEVANRAGVSVGTVSNVLNGKLGQYSGDTSERVLEAVRSLGYHPNRIARSLVQRASYTLGVSFVDQGQWLGENPYLANILDGVAVAAREENYNVMLHTRLASNSEQQYLPTLLDRRIDALCIVAPGRSNRLPALLTATDLPFIVVGVEEMLPNINWIDVDNALGAQMAMDLLFAKGHTRIAHLGGTPEQKAAQTRAKTYRDAMASRGLSLPPHWLTWCNFDTESAQKAARELLMSHNPPTAIFAADDQVAIGVMEAAHALGLCVPRDLSVIGFDDIREARFLTPPLTTIRQPVVQIGYDAAKWLIALLHGKVVSPMQRRVTPTLIERGTVGPPCR